MLPHPLTLLLFTIPPTPCQSCCRLRWGWGCCRWLGLEISSASFLPSLNFITSDIGNDGESDLRVKHDVHWLGLCNATRSIVWSSRLEPVCLNLGEQPEKDGRNETPRALQVVLPGIKHLKTSWIYWLMLYHSPSYMNILCVATVILTLSNVSSLSRALQVSSELSYYLC